MEQTNYYTLHYTNENGDDITKDIYLTKEEVKKVLHDLLNTYESYGSDNVRGLLVTEGDSEDQLALYWSADGSDWTQDFDYLEFEADDDFGKTDLLDIELKEDWVDDLNFYNLEDIISNLSGNMDEASLDSTLILFKRIAKKLGVKDYKEVYSYVDDGSYDPLYIFQDGQYMPYRQGEKLIYFPGANLVAEYFGGNIHIYATSEEDLKKFIKTAEEYLNPINLDEGFDFAEDHYDSKDDCKKLKRIDDDFCW